MLIYFLKYNNKICYKIFLFLSHVLCELFLFEHFSDDVNSDLSLFQYFCDILIIYSNKQSDP